MTNEIIISQWKEPVYLEEYDMFKNRKFLKFLDSILFMFFPEIHLHNCGILFRNKIKLLNVKTNKTRIITEDLRGGK